MCSGALPGLYSSTDEQLGTGTGSRRGTDSFVTGKTLHGATQPRHDTLKHQESRICVSAIAIRQSRGPRAALCGSSRRGGGVVVRSTLAISLMSRCWRCALFICNAFSNTLYGGTMRWTCSRVRKGAACGVRCAAALGADARRLAECAVQSGCRRQPRLAVQGG